MENKIRVLLAAFIVAVTVACSQYDDLMTPPNSTTTESSDTAFSVTYYANGASSGIVPMDSGTYKRNQLFIVLGNTGNLVKPGYKFAGWSTRAAGGGLLYSAGQTAEMGRGNIDLYAQWTLSKLFVAVGSNGASYTSTDGVSWKADSGPGGTGTLMSVVYGSVSDLFIACGSSGKAYYSRNATTWTPVETGTGDILTSVAYGDGLYVACAETASRAYYSSDGLNWSESIVALEGYDIIYDNGLFLMGGNGGYSGYATAGQVSESDWISIRQASWYSIYGYAYGNSVYVGITVNGTIDVSAVSNITTWTNKFDAGVQLNAVVFGDGHFVTVGNSGTIYFSPDSGNTWTPATAPGSADIHDVCYADGKFVAVGTGGAIYYSADNGATWTAAASPGTEDLQGICYRP